MTPDNLDAIRARVTHSGPVDWGRYIRLAEEAARDRCEPGLPPLGVQP